MKRSNDSKLRLSKNGTSLLVLQGFVMGFNRTMTRIYCPTAGYFDVRWKDNRLPDGVKIGVYITILGNIITLDLGKHFMVSRCQLLRPKLMRELKNFIKENGHGKEK